MKRDENCNRCELHTQPYHNICLWGQGPVPAPLMLVGEAPGASEDRTGKPFCGQAGELLDHILYKLGLDREDIYITNVLKCRPTANKLPNAKGTQACVDACWPYLMTELQNVDPKAVLLLGGTAMTTLTGLRLISRHEGTQVDTVYEGAKTFVGFHPAYVLRSPSKEANLARSIAIAAKAAGMRIKTKTIEEVPPYEYEIRT